jgi:hypothetical protein
MFMKNLDIPFTDFPQTGLNSGGKFGNSRSKFGKVTPLVNRIRSATSGKKNIFINSWFKEKTTTWVSGAQ